MSRGKKNAAFTAKLRDWVKRENLNGVKLAKRLNISTSAAYGYLDGRVPEWWVLVRLAREWHTSIDQMLSGEEKHTEGARVAIHRAHAPSDVRVPDPDTAQLVGMAWSVLESDTTTAAALAANVREFYEKVFDDLPAGSTSKPPGQKKAGQGGGHT